LETTVNGSEIPCSRDDEVDDLEKVSAGEVSRSGKGGQSRRLPDVWTWIINQ